MRATYVCNPVFVGCVSDENPESVYRPRRIVRLLSIKGINFLCNSVQDLTLMTIFTIEIQLYSLCKMIQKRLSLLNTTLNSSINVRNITSAGHSDIENVAESKLIFIVKKPPACFSNVGMRLIWVWNL